MRSCAQPASSSKSALKGFSLLPIPRAKLSRGELSACLSLFHLRKLQAAVIKIEDLNTRSAEIRSKLRAFLDHPEYLPDVKTRWLLASLDIALEHQEAILLLIRSKLFGSTFAMVRIIFDTMRRALWINECATEQQIEEAWRDELDWLRIPVRADMERTCFSAATPARRDEFFSLLKEVWPAMCDYTHSGARQMTRRFSNGELKPNYTEDEIHEAINATNAALMLLSTQVFLKMGRVREAEEALQLLIEYSTQFKRTP